MLEYQKMKTKHYKEYLEELVIASQKRILNVNKKDYEILRNSHKVISAIDYVMGIEDCIAKEVDILKFIENSLTECFENKGDNKIIDILDLLSQYSKVIALLDEFENLSIAISHLVSFLTNINAQDIEIEESIYIYLYNIVQDLKNWREVVFDKVEAKDIHYLDSSLISSFLQIQFLITNTNTLENEENTNLELF
jgi:two-component system chemotaxis response regulator CheY